MNEQLAQMKESIEAPKSERRARLSIRMEDYFRPNTTLAALLDAPIALEICIYGATEAFINHSQVAMEVTDSKGCPFKERPIHGWLIPRLPDAIKPGDPTIRYPVMFIHTFTEDEVKTIKAGKSFAHCAAFTQYSDVWDRKWKIILSKRWQMSDLADLVKSHPGNLNGYWLSCDNEGETRE